MYPRKADEEHESGSRLNSMKLRRFFNVRSAWTDRIHSQFALTEPLSPVRLDESDSQWAWSPPSSPSMAHGLTAWLYGPALSSVVRRAGPASDNSSAPPTSIPDS